MACHGECHKEALLLDLDVPQAIHLHFGAAVDIDRIWYVVFDPCHTLVHAVYLVHVKVALVLY